MAKTSIGWTEQVWNPVMGCSKVSEGCRHCYAERWAMDKGFTPKGLFWTTQNATRVVQLKPDRLDQPAKVKEGTMFFVNSMSDVFHPLVPFDYIDQIWHIMAQTPRHTYQILTKRPKRMLEYMQGKKVLPNVWLGTSVEDDKTINLRLPFLIQVPTVVRFISLEPCLSLPLALKEFMPHLNWVIVGGESGMGCRPMPKGAPAYVRDLCNGSGVAFFFKQWGGEFYKRDGDDALLDGRLYQEYPVDPPKAEPAPEPPKQLKLF